MPCPPPGDLLDPGTEPVSLTSPALADTFVTTSASWEAPFPQRSVIVFKCPVLFRYPPPASRDSERLSPTPAPDSPHAIPQSSSLTRLAMVSDCVQCPEIQIEVLLSPSEEGLPYSSGTALEYSCFSSSSQYSVPVRDMELL